jgi:hypothetical protein
MRRNKFKNLPNTSNQTTSRPLEQENSAEGDMVRGGPVEDLGHEPVKGLLAPWQEWLEDETEIVHTFGWPRAVYSDNGSHFTG